MRYTLIVNGSRAIAHTADGAIIMARAILAQGKRVTIRTDWIEQTLLGPVARFSVAEY